MADFEPPPPIRRKKAVCGYLLVVCLLLLYNYVMDVEYIDKTHEDLKKLLDGKSDEDKQTIFAVIICLMFGLTLNVALKYVDNYRLNRC